jgi:capsule polysaccharide export protein KpsE/RkpR
VSDSFDPFQFLEYARSHARVPAVIVGFALVSSLAISIALPDRYTATAVMLIEPPGGSDPRVSTAVSPVYLESLKTYEEFAASDTLFARACDKFHLLGPGSPSIESFKKHVLEVRKPKETKVLQLAVTLGDPRQAQAVAQFLAEQTVALNDQVAGETDRAAARRARTELERATAERLQARMAASEAANTGTEIALTSEIEALVDTRSNLDVQIAEAKALSIQEKLRGRSEEAAAQEARIAALATERDDAVRRLQARQDQLSRTTSRREQAEARLQLAEQQYQAASRRATELDTVAGMRGERLRIIDPGIIPQRPSSPNLLLNCTAAFAGAIVFTLIYLAAGFGLDNQRSRHARAAFQVARRGSA